MRCDRSEEKWTVSARAMYIYMHEMRWDSQHADKVHKDNLDEILSISRRLKLNGRKCIQIVKLESYQYE